MSYKAKITDRGCARYAGH